jgi:hypothetical protein
MIKRETKGSGYGGGRDRSIRRDHRDRGEKGWWARREERGERKEERGVRKPRLDDATI